MELQRNLHFWSWSHSITHLYENELDSTSSAELHTCGLAVFNDPLPSPPSPTSVQEKICSQFANGQSFDPFLFSLVNDSEVPVVWGIFSTLTWMDLMKWTSANKKRDMAGLGTHIFIPTVTQPKPNHSCVLRAASAMRPRDQCTQLNNTICLGRPLS